MLRGGVSEVYQNVFILKGRHPGQSSVMELRIFGGSVAVKPTAVLELLRWSLPGWAVSHFQLGATHLDLCTI
jgi:hypothetical protein